MRPKRSAAASAQTRIAKAIESESEDSNGSNFNSQNSSSSGDDEPSGNESNNSDAEYTGEPEQPRNYGRGGRKTKANQAPNKKGASEPTTTAESTTTSSSSNTVTTTATETTTTETTTTSSNENATSNGNSKELSDDSLKCLIRNFRLTDLQALMIFVGKNKAGRKTELLERACDLVDSTSGEIKKRLCEKIQELHSSMFRSIASAPSVNPYSATYRPTSNSVSTTNDTNTVNSNSSYSPVHLNSNNSIPSPRYDNSYPYYSSQNSHSLVYPTFPDVNLRTLPFYKVDSVLMKPSSLQPRGHARFQEQTFSFHLTPTQASAIAQSSCRDAFGRQDFKKQIQLRFSLLETTCEQDDNFPASVCVKVNGRLQPLPNPIPTNKPGVEPKRPPKPINITGLCKLSSTVPNYLNVSWAVEVGSGYTVSVYYVEKLSSSDLMDELKKKGKRNADFTRGIIKDKLSDKEDEISTTSCKVTLACPLGKMRMNTPCRSKSCDHLQCFDANLYLMMNEKKPKWICPVCNKSALYDDLFIDGYFSDVINSKKLPRDEHEIVLHNDASWDPLVIPKKKDESDPKVKQENQPADDIKKEDIIKKKEKVETLEIDDDDDDDIPIAQAFAPKLPVKSKEAPVDCVTLESDEEDEILPPSSKRPRILEDDQSDSVSALTTPSSVTPPPTVALDLRNGSSSPEIICLDDD